MTTDQERVKEVRNRVEESEEISEANRDILLQYDDILQRRRGSEIKANRHYKDLYAVLDLAERGFDLHKLIVPRECQHQNGLTDSERRAEETIKEIDTHVKDRGFKDSVIDDRFTKLRTFINALGNTEWIPNMIEYANTSHYNPRENVPNVHEILWYEDDVTPMIENRRQNNYRDSAWMAMLWASGGRPQSEIYSLNMSNLEIRKNRIELRIPEDTKTGYRTREIYTGVPYVREWLKEHPTAEMDENSDTPVWVKLNGDQSQRVSYSQLASITKAAGKEAGVDKPCNPQWFRKSRASVAALRQGYSIDDMRQAFGWEQRTATPEYYVAKFGKQASRDLAEIEGATIEDDERTKAIAPVKCPDCSQYTTRFRGPCLWCGTDIDPDEGRAADEAARAMKETANESWNALVEAVVSGEIDKENLKKGEMMAEVARNHPEAIGRLQDLFDLQE
ncbi:site-specific integrase [Natrinema amylolyticum]|uniref:site-specific integrase n=1 Tax=Natrinema amylolyticum TaxID=2878679 RepID=UPI001CFA59A7|nr:site-specific integrase [Natrinema amylolyticum]